MFFFWSKSFSEIRTPILINNSPFCKTDYRWLHMTKSIKILTQIAIAIAQI